MGSVNTNKKYGIPDIFINRSYGAAACGSVSLSSRPPTTDHESFPLHQVQDLPPLVSMTAKQLVDVIFCSDSTSTPPRQIHLQSSTGDGKSTFLYCIEILARGMVSMFGDQSGVVHLNDLSTESFNLLIAERMRRDLNLYPVLQPATPESIASKWVAPDIAAFETAVDADGMVYDYGVCMRLSYGEVIIQFKDSSSS